MPFTAFLPNLVVLAVGVAVAGRLLRTGMVRPGVLLLVGLFVAVDVALLARYAYDQRGAPFLVPLLCMQVLALGAAVWLVFAMSWRRRWAGHREAEFARAFAHYLRDELPAAAAGFARLRRRDPWDVAATVALANVLARQGRRRRASSLWRCARRLDVAAEYRDFVAQQQRR